jgi:hypothetical protein
MGYWSRDAQNCWGLLSLSFIVLIMKRFIKFLNSQTKKTCTFLKPTRMGGALNKKCSKFITDSEDTQLFQILSLYHDWWLIGIVLVAANSRIALFTYLTIVELNPLELPQKVWVVLQVCSLLKLEKFTKVFLGKFKSTPKLSISRWSLRV